MKKVYLASPFFDEGANEILDKIESMLDELEIPYFSPRKHNILKPFEFHRADAKKRTFDANLKNIEDADFLIAVPYNKDMGTVFECGHAYAKGIPIVYFAPFLNGAPFNLMLAESGHSVLTDYGDLHALLYSFLQKGDLDQFKVEYEGKIE